MTSLDTPPGSVGADNDKSAIVDLHRLHALQRKAFLADSYPEAAERKEHLAALAGMVLGHRNEIRAAMRTDFAAHPDLFTDLIEVLGVAGRAAYATEQLDRWLAEDERPADPAVFGTARAGIRHEPKGVVGTIVPWNFPFDLSLGPLVEMLAAGNRVIIKPSDHTPACADLLQRMIGETFGEDRVAVAVGGLGLAREFPTLRWDHLLYTGSPAIGRAVALAAAANLVPVTLELGGKCPAILTADSVDAQSVRDVVGAKLVKNGQMCVSVDYVLVPRAHLDAFVTHARRYLDDELPDYASTVDCTGIITERHSARIVAMLDEATLAEARVVTLGGAGDPATRRLPLTLVVDPPADLRIMREEIFGPILPVIPYDDLDDALAVINAGERPLGLYVYSKDPQIAEHVLRHTTSGGACVNVCAVQGALPSLGFGGIGRSHGRHHGVEGFREFSNPRGVVVRGAGDMIDAFLPPYGPMAQAIVDSVFGSDTAGGTEDSAQEVSDPAMIMRLVRSLDTPERAAVALAARWVRDGRRLEMRGLADELGVNRVTLFRQAGSREELLGKALCALTETTLAIAARRWEAQRPEGALHSPGTGRHINALVSRSAALRRLLDDEPTLTIRILTDPRGLVQTTVVAFTEALIRRDMAEFGLVPLIDPGTLAFALVRLGESFLYADVLASRQPDVATADRLQAALVEGLRP